MRSGRIDSVVGCPGSRAATAAAKTLCPVVSSTRQMPPETSRTMPFSRLFSPMKRATNALAGLLVEPLGRVELLDACRR